MGESPPDILCTYRELGVEPLINAAGNATLIGGSIMPAEVIDGMAAASRHFVDLPQLHQAAGRRIAELIRSEAAHVCACTYAGITLMAAACMVGTDPDIQVSHPQLWLRVHTLQAGEGVILAWRLGQVLAERIPPTGQQRES